MQVENKYTHCVLISSKQQINTPKMTLSYRTISIVNIEKANMYQQKGVLFWM